jgi:hypothetical protein
MSSVQDELTRFVDVSFCEVLESLMCIRAPIEDLYIGCLGDLFDPSKSAQEIAHAHQRYEQVLRELRHVENTVRDIASLVYGSK